MELMGRLFKAVKVTEQCFEVHLQVLSVDVRNSPEASLSFQCQIIQIQLVGAIVTFSFHCLPP